MRPFKEKNLRAEGNVLPLSSFRPFSDMSEPKYNKRKLDRVVSIAERMLDEPVPMLTASLYRDFFLTGNRARFEKHYLRRRYMATHLALAESYEKKGRFTEKLADTVWAILEESSWIIPAHLHVSPFGFRTLPEAYGNNALHGIDLFSAGTGALLAFINHIAKDALDSVTPVISEKLRYMIAERITRPFLECTFFWTGDNGARVNNWNPWIIANVLTVMALNEESMYKRERTVTLAMQRLDNFFAGYKADGGCDEGPVYWGVAGAAMFDCLELLEDISGGRLTVYDNELVKNIGEYIYKVNINGTRFVNFADCAPRTSPPASLLVRFGTKCDSPFLVSFGKKQAVFGDYLTNESLMYRTVKTLMTPDIDSDDCPMPTVTYLPDLKVMTARESSDSSHGTFLAAKGGTNDEMHNHNDVGNFIVYKNGNPVIIDTGVGQYTKQTFSPQRYELWFMQSGYHNLPSFDGVDQRNGPAFKSTSEHHDPDKKSLTLELKEAYPVEAGIKSYVRCSALTGDTVTVHDVIELNGAKEIVFHFMTHYAPVKSGDGEIKLTEGMTFRFDPALKCEIEEFEPVGMDTKATWDTEVLWRIKLSAVTDRIDTTFTVG